MPNADPENHIAGSLHAFAEIEGQSILAPERVPERAYAIAPMASNDLCSLFKRYFGFEDMKRRLLLDIVPSGSVAAERARIDQENEAYKRAFDRVLMEYRDAPSRDAASFARYCERLVRLSRRELRGKRSERFLQQFLGIYLEAGLKEKRNSGRPAMGAEGLYVHVWHCINLDRAQAGKKMLTGRVPARAIAARCSVDGFGAHTPRQVSDALRREKRTLHCPYYGENIEN